MTTNAEINRMLESPRPDMDWIFRAYSETPERREKLAQSLFGYAQMKLDRAVKGRDNWAAEDLGLNRAIRRLEDLTRVLDGSEKVDQVRLLSLLGDLRGLRDQIHQAALARYLALPRSGGGRD